jgi:arylsulfatase A-like enzyme
MMSEGWDDRQVDLRFTKEAVSYIESHQDSPEESPFFLYLTPSAPHRPCVPPDFLEGKSNAGLRGDMVLTVDYIVGKVLAALERTGQKEDTLVIISSDNGARSVNYDGKDHGHKPNGDWRGQKGDIYEGGHREPCVAMWPAVIMPGTESSELLSLVDLFATVVNILGDDPIVDGAEDSLSFYSVLQGESLQEPIHDAVVHHSLDGMFSLRKGPWKAVFGLGSGGFSEPTRYPAINGGTEGQLYNIADDSQETNNVWSQKPEIVAEFKRILTAYQNSGYSRQLSHNEV